MATTSTWITLVGGSAGAVGALVGVVINQLLTDRRETARWMREQIRQNEAWQREDAARTYEQRRDAYLTYAKEWHRHYDLIHEYYERRANEYEPDPNEDALRDLYQHLLQVEIFGTHAGRVTARGAYDALSRWLFQGGRPDEGIYEAYQEQVREDLGVPPDRNKLAPRPQIQQRSTATNRAEPDHEGPIQPV